MEEKYDESEEVKKLEELVKQHHDPDLVKPDETPNGNTQILIFNDGEIVSTKGGHAFLQRSMIIIRGAVMGYKGHIPLPMKFGDKNTFAIVKDFDTAELIRKQMIKIWP